MIMSHGRQEAARQKSILTVRWLMVDQGKDLVSHQGAMVVGSVKVYTIFKLSSCITTEAKIPLQASLCCMAATVSMKALKCKTLSAKFATVYI